MGRRKKKPRKGENDNELPIPPMAATASSSSAPPPWVELPDDVTANILQRLGAEEILTSAERVCSTWRKVCKDPAMWRVIDLIADACWREETYLMCRCAVDRSQGQLVDLSIDNFEDDDLLSYVARRSSHLRRLTLVNSFELSPSALAEAVKKIPQLETLHLINISPLDAECVEAIGISCPLLKSFIYDEVFGDVEEGNRIALAIAKTMPNLHHLQPAKYWEDYEGLKAIRDGCPYLESFDLLGRYEAHDLYISGDLRESKVGPGPMRKVRQPGPKKKNPRSVFHL